MDFPSTVKIAGFVIIVIGAVIVAFTLNSSGPNAGTLTLGLIVAGVGVVAMIFADKFGS